MAYIHGAVSWTDAIDRVSSDVRLMLEAVGGEQWVASKTFDVEQAGSCCVLGYQLAPGDRAEDAVAQTECPSLHVVADLDLLDTGGVSHLLGHDETGAARIVAQMYRCEAERGGRQLLADGVFALWDSDRRRLMCWRDPAGTRPLYYSHAPGRHFVFSSDLRSIGAHSQVPLLLDLEYARSRIEIGRYFAHRERTLCRDVRKLPPAHMLLVDSEGCSIERYWDPDELVELRHRNDAEYVEELRELLRAAVASRLPDTSLQAAAHLSGGLDSTSVAVLAQRELTRSGRRVTAISWAPPFERLAEQPFDERNLAVCAAVAAGIELQFSRIRPEDHLALHARDLALQPTAALHLEFAASRIALASGASRVLSGWGGDELVAFNGQGYLAALARRGRWLTLRRELNLRAQIHGGRAFKSNVVVPLVPEAVLARLRPDLARSRHTFPPYLRPEFAEELRSVEPLADPRLVARPGVRRTQRAQLESGHVEYRMESWASYGADVGLRYSFPLLDKRLMEFALSVPDHLFFKAGWKRWIYRSAMEGILPDDVRWNKDKYDLAMGIAQAEAGAAAVPRAIEQLRERADNAYVDVEGLINRDPAAGARDEAPESNTRWLAYTQVGLR